MATRSAFQRGRSPAPSGRKLQKKEIFDLRGLNLSDPHNLVEDSQATHLRNARLFELDKEDPRRVAISTRKGSRLYVTPLGETQDQAETSGTGVADQTITISRWLAQPFTPATAGRLSKVELNIKKNTATGQILIFIHRDNSGEPGQVIAKSSITINDLTTSYQYMAARFIEAPMLSTSNDYWIVAKIQTGTDPTDTTSYNLQSTTNSTDALLSTNSGTTWSAQSFSLQFKQYYATDGGVKGATRFYPTSGAKRTIFAHGADIYEVDDQDGSASSIKSGLSPAATDYYFAQADDKLFIVNGVDVPQKWDGTTMSDLGGNPGVSKLIAHHKNRLFLVPTNDPNRINFSDIDTNLADYETYESTAFVYVPSPRTADPITALIPFQDSLIIFTKETKYVLSGSSLATFTLRQATGKKGAVSTRSVKADENYIYFVADDGIYRFNGAEDELISDRITPEFRNIANLDRVSAEIHNREYRVYYRPKGKANHERMLLWDITYSDWFLDDAVHTRVTNVQQQDNGNPLVHFSDKMGAAYWAESQQSDLGRPIEFEYWTKYHDFSASATKKQVRRFYPIIRSQAWDFYVTLEVDRDFLNAPTYTKSIAVKRATDADWGDGSEWGAFTWGGGATIIQPRYAISGANTHYQFRFSSYGVDNPVELLGYAAYYRFRRPK